MQRGRNDRPGSGCVLGRAAQASVGPDLSQLSGRDRLLRHSLDSHGYISLSDPEAKRVNAAYDAGDEQAFCHQFGPEKIPEHLSEFLGYFMVRKVMAGQELLKTAGAVTGKHSRAISARSRCRSAPAISPGRGWMVFIVAARVKRRWHLLEVGSVYPS